MQKIRASRTPPGVRELKLFSLRDIGTRRKCRTPPGVRELKLDPGGSYQLREGVAPLPGCVN